MKGKKCYADHIILLEVTLRKRFLSCMAFSIYEVFRVACQSHSLFRPGKVYKRGTSVLRVVKVVTYQKKEQKVLQLN